MGKCRATGPLFSLRATNPTPRPLPEASGRVDTDRREGELNTARRKVFRAGGGISARVSTDTEFVKSRSTLTAQHPRSASALQTDSGSMGARW